MSAHQGPGEEDDGDGVGAWPHGIEMARAVPFSARRRAVAKLSPTTLQAARTRA